MSILYTTGEVMFLTAKAKERGDPDLNLELGSDGIYRTKEEHIEWVKQRALEDK